MGYRGGHAEDWRTDGWCHIRLGLNCKRCLVRRATYGQKFTFDLVRAGLGGLVLITDVQRVVESSG